MTFTALTDADRDAMLAAVGVGSIEELFHEIPEAVRLGRELDLEPALTEAELMAHLAELASRNVDAGREIQFLGAGIYDHYVPAICDAVMQRGELLTAYTPYQPEMSQGTLQAIFEYQTAICELTGMDVSNASGYDGLTVAADACYVARAATRRTKVVVAETLNPQVRHVVRTFAPGFGMEVVEVPHDGGTTDPDAIRAAAEDAACVIFQQPNFFGCLEPAPDIAAAASEAGALPVAHVDLLSLGRARGAGQLRLRARDRRGPVGREPHELRRAALRVHGRQERAHPAAARPDRRGDARPRGQARVRAHAPDARAAHPAREGHLEHHDQPDAPGAGGAGLPVLARPAGPGRHRAGLPVARGGGKRVVGLPQAFDRPTFKEFALDLGRPAEAVVKAARAQGVHPGYPLGRDYPGMENLLLVAVTEKRTRADIARLAEVLAA